MKYFLLLALVACLAWGCNRQNSSSPKSPEMCATCAARLRMIDAAKGSWAEQNQKTPNDTPKIEDLSPFLRGQPACPSGGTYTMTQVGEPSVCSIPEHTAYYKTNASPK